VIKAGSALLNALDHFWTSWFKSSPKVISDGSGFYGVDKECIVVAVVAALIILALLSYILKSRGGGRRNGPVDNFHPYSNQGQQTGQEGDLLQRLINAIGRLNGMRGYIRQLQDKLDSVMKDKIDQLEKDTDMTQNQLRKLQTIKDKNLANSRELTQALDTLNRELGKQDEEFSNDFKTKNDLNGLEKEGNQLLDQSENAKNQLEGNRPSPDDEQAIEGLINEIDNFCQNGMNNLRNIDEQIKDSESKRQQDRVNQALKDLRDMLEKVQDWTTGAGDADDAKSDPSLVLSELSKSRTKEIESRAESLKSQTTAWKQLYLDTQDHCAKNHVNKNEQKKAKCGRNAKAASPDPYRPDPQNYPEIEIPELPEIENEQGGDMEMKGKGSKKKSKPPKLSKAEKKSKKKKGEAEEGVPADGGDEGIVQESDQDAVKTGQTPSAARPSQVETNYTRNRVSTLRDSQVDGTLRGSRVSTLRDSQVAETTRGSRVSSLRESEGEEIQTGKRASEDERQNFGSSRGSRDDGSKSGKKRSALGDYAATGSLKKKSGGRASSRITETPEDMESYSQEETNIGEDDVEKNEAAQRASGVSKQNIETSNRQSEVPNKGAESSQRQSEDSKGAKSSKIQSEGSSNGAESSKRQSESSNKGAESSQRQSEDSKGAKSSKIQSEGSSNGAESSKRQSEGSNKGEESLNRHSQDPNMQDPKTSKRASEVPSKATETSKPPTEPPRKATNRMSGTRISTKASESETGTTLTSSNSSDSDSDSESDRS